MCVRLTKICGPLRRAADLEHERLDVLADPVVLERALLGRGEDRLDVLADVEDDRPRLDPVDRAGHQLALAARELVEDLVALDLADALEDDLLGGLRADPAEDVAVELLGLDEVADLGVGLDGVCACVDGHLGELVLDLADDAARAEDADLAGLGIDPDVDVLVTGDAPVGGLDAVLDGSDQLLARDLLFGVELEEGTDEVSTHDDLRSLCDVHGRRSKRNVGVTHVAERPFSCREVYTRERGRLKRDPGSGRRHPRPMTLRLACAPVDRRRTARKRPSPHDQDAGLARLVGGPTLHDAPTGPRLVFWAVVAPRGRCVPLGVVPASRCPIDARRARSSTASIRRSSMTFTHLPLETTTSRTTRRSTSTTCRSPYLAMMRNWVSRDAFDVGRFLFLLPARRRRRCSSRRQIRPARCLVFPNTFEYFFDTYEAIRTRWDPRRLRARTCLDRDRRLHLDRHQAAAGVVDPRRRSSTRPISSRRASSASRRTRPGREAIAAAPWVIVVVALAVGRARACWHAG